MSCPLCGSKNLKIEDWAQKVKNWKTASCRACGFSFDYQSGQEVFKLIEVRKKGSKTTPYKPLQTKEQPK